MDIQAYGAAMAEDVRSLEESWPYLTRYGEASAPAACDRCGEPVVAVPETLAAAGPPRWWADAIWDAGLGRKHTRRRCEWLRDHAGDGVPPAC